MPRPVKRSILVLLPKSISTSKDGYAKAQTAGLNGIMDMFTPKGGLNLTGALTALAATNEGAELVKRITGTKTE